MKNLITIINLVLWSSLSIAITTSPYVPVYESDYGYKKEESIAIAIPPAKNQLLPDNCWAVTSSYAIESILCQQEKISDCSKINSERQDLVVSPFAVSGLNRKIRETSGNCIDAFSKLDLNAGSAAGVLNNYIDYSCPGVPSNQCYPMDKFINLLQNQKDFEKKIRENSLGKDLQGNICIECAIDEVQKAMGTTVPEKAVKTYKEVFDSKNLVGQTMFSDCRKKGLILEMGPPSPNIYNFPPFKYDSQLKINVNNYADEFTDQEFINKIKEVLSKTKQTVVMEGFCGEYIDGKCAFDHAQLITGYRKVCKCASGSGSSCKPNNNDCRELVQVLNTWGKSWQKNNNDGWVDAHELLKARVPKSLSLTWMQPRYIKP